MKNIHTLFVTLLLLTANMLTGQAFWATHLPPFTDTLGTYDVEVTNANTAWFLCQRGASGGAEVGRTTDGGVTFYAGTLPLNGIPYTPCMTSTDENTAYVMALQDFGNSVTLKTTDGGQSWQNTNTPWDPVVSWPDFIHAFSPAKICQIGDPRDGEFEIYTTGSGGVGWGRVPGANIPDPLAGEFGWNNCGDFAGNHIWFGTNLGRVYHSANAGLSWEVAQTPLSGVIGGISFADENNGIVAGLYFFEDSITTPLFKTADGGVTWSAITLPISEPYHFYGAPGCVKGTPNIVAGVYTNPPVLGKNQTWLSTDRGDTWKQISDGEIIGWPTFYSPTVGWAGEWGETHPTRVFSYSGSPLVGLFRANQLDVTVSLSPNPAAEMLRLEVRGLDAGDYWLLLNDAQGRLVQKTIVTTAADISQSLDLSGLPGGVFNLTITGATGMVTKQVVKY